MTDRAALSREAVVDAAIALLDDVGFRGFTMRGLAQRLETYPTTIYWHVGNRDEVISACDARLTAEALVGLPDVETTPWDEWLIALARAYRDLLHAHPFLAALAVTRFEPEVVTPEAFELIIRALSRAGFEGPALTGAYNTLIGSLGGWVGMELLDGDSLDAFDPERMEASVRALTADDYPAIAANVEHLADQAFTFRWHGGRSNPLDDAFEFALQTWIGGLRAQLDRHEG
jgi:AcrR family transcriptional regulator